MKDVQYPIGIVDAICDALLNSVYLKFGSEGPQKQGAMTILTYAILTEDGEALRHLTEMIKNAKRGIAGLITDFFSSPTRPDASSTLKGSFNPYRSFNVNPNAWASRFARVCVIANAKESVILCQQRIACPPYGGQDFNNKFNSSMHLQEPYLWDGYLWPFGKILSLLLASSRTDLTIIDLLIAFGYALARTRNSKSGSAKVTIVLATHCSGGNRGDWADSASIGDLKRKLKAVMRGMAYLDGFTSLVPSFFTNAAAAADVFTHVDPVPEHLIDKVVDEQFQVRRALGNNTWYYNHSKIVCVDDRLLYAGSDNAYPCYNEEHGVWIEDAAKVASWKKKFWNEMWARAVVPDDEPEK
jgi:hypothetical protein